MVRAICKCIHLNHKYHKYSYFFPHSPVFETFHSWYESYLKSAGLYQTNGHLDRCARFWVWVLLWGLTQLINACTLTCNDDLYTYTHIHMYCIYIQYRYLYPPHPPQTQRRSGATSTCTHAWYLIGTHRSYRYSATVFKKKTIYCYGSKHCVQS